MATPTPNLTLTQYSTTDNISFIDDYNVDMTKIDSAVGVNTTNIGTLASLKTAVKTSVVNSINEVYDTTDNGWISARATLTYASASAPTFVCNTNTDLTTRISVGMKIKLTQTTTKYFFVTAITSTTITLYGGTTYSVANATISNVYFSSVQLPYGFPIASTGLGEDFIIENGSNANGSYTKWASGKLEMWGYAIIQADLNGTAYLSYPTSPISTGNSASLTFGMIPHNTYGDTVMIASNVDIPTVTIKAVNTGAASVISNGLMYFHWSFKGKWK